METEKVLYSHFAFSILFLWFAASYDTIRLLQVFLIAISMAFDFSLMCVMPALRRHVARGRKRLGSDIRVHRLFCQRVWH
jgi:hypothetical protein